jgi:hypothetical protein
LRMNPDNFALIHAAVRGIAQHSGTAVVPKWRVCIRVKRRKAGKIVQGVLCHRRNPDLVDSSSSEEEGEPPLPQLDGGDGDEYEQREAAAQPEKDSNEEQIHDQLEQVTKGADLEKTTFRLLERLDQPLRPVIRSLAFNTKMKNVRLCVEGLAVVVRMTVDHEATEHSARGVRALQEDSKKLWVRTRTKDSEAHRHSSLDLKISTIATTIEGRIRNTPQPGIDTGPYAEDIQAWQAFVEEYGEVEKRQQLSPGSLNAVAKRVRAALGAAAVKAITLPQQHAMPPVGRKDASPTLRVFHGLRRLAVRTARSDFELHDALSRPQSPHNLSSPRSLSYAAHMERGPDADVVGSSQALRSMGSPQLEAGPGLRGGGTVTS